MTQGPAGRWKTWSAWLLFAVVVLSVTVGTRRPSLLAADNSYHLVTGWLQAPASVPMGFVSWVDVDPSGMIQIRRWSRIAEYIRPQVRAERSHVLPLGITGFEPMADLNPAAFAYALVRTAKRFNKPWHQLCRFSL